jgi:hypothetical protein
VVGNTRLPDGSCGPPTDAEAVMVSVAPGRGFQVTARVDDNCDVTISDIHEGAAEDFDQPPPTDGELQTPVQSTEPVSEITPTTEAR